MAHGDFPFSCANTVSENYAVVAVHQEGKRNGLAWPTEISEIRFLSSGSCANAKALERGIMLQKHDFMIGIL